MWRSFPRWTFTASLGPVWVGGRIVVAETMGTFSWLAFQTDKYGFSSEKHHPSWVIRNQLIICPLSEESCDQNPHMQIVKRISSQLLRGAVGREPLRIVKSDVTKRFLKMTVICWFQACTLSPCTEQTIRYLLHVVVLISPEIFFFFFP